VFKTFNCLTCSFHHFHSTCYPTFPETTFGDRPTGSNWKNVPVKRKCVCIIRCISCWHFPAPCWPLILYNFVYVHVSVNVLLMATVVKPTSDWCNVVFVVLIYWLGCRGFSGVLCTAWLSCLYVISVSLCLRTFWKFENSIAVNFLIYRSCYHKYWHVAVCSLVML